ncbi:MAG: hypothetical protein C4516_09095 [Oxalobacter sp.]|nr:MAG: hypothetical protein C4516_09095 [Oxalobacter sp.]
MNILRLNTSLGKCDIFWIVDYHKYHIHDQNGQKQKNPMVDEVSRHLMDLKSTENKNFDIAVAKKSRLVLRELDTVLEKNEKAILCLVPSSKANKYGPGLLRIAQFLQRKDSRIAAVTNLIQRKTSIVSLHSGGDRNISIHKGSLAIGEKIKQDRTYIILDDIATSGNSLAVCADMIEYQGARRVIPLAIGKTYA